MKVLVACEYSGVVRDAFIRHGHDALSCDLLPSDAPGPHYQGDVFDLIGEYFDLVITHPPCTYLCSSGLHWNKRVPGRAALTEESLVFVRRLMDWPAQMVAVENPVGCIGTRIRKADQIIQPWQFGHPESKSTCLWLKNLPLLVPTDVRPLPTCGHWDNQTPGGQNKLGPSDDRWKVRSTTYAGIGDAMAEQWGDVRAPWEPCDCCEDFVCSIHEGEHVGDCSCPDIDWWSERGLSPYLPCHVNLNEYLI